MGIGNDIYIVDILKTSRGALALQSVVRESVNQGDDTLQLRALTNLNFAIVPTVALGVNIERLDATFVDASNKINLTGNSAANILTGNDADNILNGGAGADTLSGAGGNDTYILDTMADIVLEDGVDLHDKVVIAYRNLSSAVTLNVADYANIEDLAVTGIGLYNLTGTSGDNILTGNAYANTIDGGDGDDMLDGMGGIDTLIGGDGDDTYVIDNIRDVVTETGSDDNDTLIIKIAKGHYSVSSYAGIEHFVLTGSAAQNITGDGGINRLTGNNGANILDGGGGSDILSGGLGSDTYKVYGASETIIEALNGGIDTVISTETLILGDNLERLTLAGLSDIDATGNTLANILTGNTANNVLDGKAGADILIGGMGDDTYIVDLYNLKTLYRLEDTVRELNGQGADTIVLRNIHAHAPASAFTLVLANYLENFDASETAGLKINLTGNSAANILTGNDADNILNGGAGADMLSGAGGNDTYILDTMADIVLENGADLHDKVVIAYRNLSSAVTLNVADYANIEDMAVSGIGLYNLTGTSGDNILTGNAYANTIDGGDGDDMLDGMGGIDTLIGGDGDDTYVIDNIRDVVTETGSDDNDTLIIKIAKGHYSVSSYAGIEHLVLTGSAAQNITGDDKNNVLMGNIGANIINGGLGADIMLGGKGNDTYYVDEAGDIINENYLEGTDTVISSIDFSLNNDGEHIENLTLAGNAAIGVGNAANNIIIGNNNDNILDGLGGADILRGGLGNDRYDVDFVKVGKVYKMADTVVESALQGEDTIRLRDDAGLVMTTAITLSVGANIENFDIANTGALRINITGNTLNNFLVGNEAINILNGSTGHDRLWGLQGADTMIGGAGNDRFYYVAGALESSVNQTDVIKDFTSGDKITFEGASGLSYYGDYGITFNSVTAGINLIKGNDNIDDHIVYFRVGNNGYLYVKGDGDQSGTNFDGTLIMFEKKITPFTGSEIEFHTVFESEGPGRTEFVPGDTVVGSLSSHTDTDGYSFTLATDGMLELNFDVPTNFHASQPAYKIQLLDSNDAEIGEWFLGADQTILTSVTAGDYSVLINGVSSMKFSADPYTFTVRQEVSAENASVGTLMMAESVADDDIHSGTGQNILYAGAEEDIFIFGDSGEGSPDIIANFDVLHDKIELSGILEGFDPLAPAIENFVSVTTENSNSIVSIDRDGAGADHNMTPLTVLTNVTGQDADMLFGMGALVVS